MKSSAVGIGCTLLLVAGFARAEDPSRWGETEYLRYCGACHGDDAGGNGPVSSVLSPHPPALTSLHVKFGNPLSTRFVEYVAGTTMPRAHGTSAMPVWGRVLGDQAGQDSEAVEILWKITRYLDKLQKPDGHLHPEPSTDSSTGD
jgi:mono/diheme cytochrome c family protein